LGREDRRLERLGCLMRHVIGPSFCCIECVTDEELPDEGKEGYVDTTRLTVFNGYMVCLYHLPRIMSPSWKP
jgi:hypothetical protein